MRVAFVATLLLAGCNPTPVRHPKPDAAPPADAMAATAGGAGGASGAAGATQTSGAGGLDAATPQDTVDQALPRDATAADARRDTNTDTAAGVDVGSRDACRFRLCEDFESVALGQPPDPKLWTRSGDIVVGTPPERPGQAMHVRAGMVPTETYIAQSTTLPALGNAFYGRVYLYIAARPTDFFHWSFTEVRGPDARGAAVRYGGISTGACGPGATFCRNSFLFQLKPLVYGADEGATADDDFPNPVIAEKTWHCIEWYMNSATREARLWWNGEERPKMHYQDSQAIPFPTLTRLYLGWALYQTGSTGWEVWFDDLAINDQRVGCTP